MIYQIANESIRKAKTIDDLQKIENKIDEKYKMDTEVYPKIKNIKLIAQGINEKIRKRYIIRKL